MLMVRIETASFRLGIGVGAPTFVKKNDSFMILETQKNHINYQRIERAIQYLQENFHRQPDLAEVAEKVNLSPFHFQRIFSEWAGISPKRFLQYLTTNFLKEKLTESRNLDEAAAAAGLSSQSRVYDLFTSLEAMTPAEYRERGIGIRIDYGVHDSPFGQCAIGTTERGICWLSFVESEQDSGRAVEEMMNYWYNSIFHENGPLTKEVVLQIFGSTQTNKLRLFVRGTNFQVKVWEALLRIPAGSLSTYQDIARRVGRPKALQAVGSAVGANPIAYLIPCHRVIRKDGMPGDYRWNPTRKKSLIGWEMARQEMPNNH